MTGIGRAALAIALSAPALAAAAAAPSRAGAAVAYSGVGQHQTVMNDIYRAQRRNNAAISHVQNDIRSSRTRAY